ncbi:B-cell receptor-associated-like protein [Senna tora]|uniref:B-cell receptor-associated-like protein n=1 Tax=Senna tora TaxID=362788 RepID=A0A834TH83_9FABA|nr:B-cell receptor-associated-like protein [Senna tora]
MNIYKAQRNVILCVSACLLYWSIYRICKYQKDLQNLEEVEKRFKSQ